MSNFLGQFFMFWGVKRFNFFFKYCSVRTKKLHKMKLKNFFLMLGKKKINLNWIYLHKIFIKMYSIPYTRVEYVGTKSSLTFLPFIFMPHFHWPGFPINSRFAFGWYSLLDGLCFASGAIDSFPFSKIVSL